MWVGWERRILQWGTELYWESFTIHFLINSPFHKTVLDNVSVKQSCESTQNPGSSKGILQAAAHAQAPKTACKTIIISSKLLKYLQVSNCSHHHFLLARFCWQNSCLSVMYQMDYRIGKNLLCSELFSYAFFLKFKCFTLSPPPPNKSIFLFKINTTILVAVLMTSWVGVSCKIRLSSFRWITGTTAPWYSQVEELEERSWC